MTTQSGSAVHWNFRIILDNCRYSILRCKTYPQKWQKVVTLLYNWHAHAGQTPPPPPPLHSPKNNQSSRSVLATCHKNIAPVTGSSHAPAVTITVHCPTLETNSLLYHTLYKVSNSWHSYLFAFHHAMCCFLIPPSTELDSKLQLCWIKK